MGTLPGNPAPGLGQRPVAASGPVDLVRLSPALPVAVPSLPASLPRVAVYGGLFGPGPAVERVLSAAEDLESKGVKFLKKGYFTRSWKPASARKITPLLADRKAGRVAARAEGTRWVPVTSESDLAELAALQAGGSTAGLPEPVLAEGLKALQSRGTEFRAVWDGDEAQVGAYGAYNLLTGDPQGLENLTASHQGQKVTLSTPEEAFLLGHLEGVVPASALSHPEVAETLAWLEHEKYSLSPAAVPAYRALAADRTSRVQVKQGEVTVLELGAQELERPELAEQRVRQQRGRYEDLAARLPEGAPRAWELLRTDGSARDYDERLPVLLELFPKLQDPAPLYRAVLSSAAPDEPLEKALGPALLLLERQPGRQDLPEAYARLRQGADPEQYFKLLGLGLDAESAHQALALLSQDEPFEDRLSRLGKLLDSCPEPRVALELWRQCHSAERPLDVACVEAAALVHGGAAGDPPLERWVATYRQLRQPGLGPEALADLSSLVRTARVAVWERQGDWGLETDPLRGEVWSDSPGKQYRDNADFSLTSPAFDLGAATGARLSFDVRHDLEAQYDGAYLEASSQGKPWKQLATYGGGSEWHSESVDLSAFPGSGFRFRFRLKSDHTGTRDGLLLDRIRIELPGGVLLPPGDKAAPTVERLICAATEAGRTPEQLQKRLRRLADSAGRLGNVDQAFQVDQALAAHRDEPDVDVRRQALVDLAGSIGAERALELWGGLAGLEAPRQEDAARAIHQAASELGGDYGKALQLWPALRPFCGNGEDLEKRRTALCRLARLGGEETALVLWAALAPRDSDRTLSDTAVLQGLAEQLKSPQSAFQVWPLLVEHTADADFEDRKQALTRLAARVGAKAALEVWPHLQQGPGTLQNRENLYHLAEKLSLGRQTALDIYRRLLPGGLDEGGLKALDSLARVLPAHGWKADGPWGLEQVADLEMGAWSDSPGGNYLDNADCSLVSPPLDLSGIHQGRLRFEARYDLEIGYDFVSVDVSPDGRSWKTLERLNGKSDWNTRELNLCAYDGKTVQIRFRLTSDHTGNRPGIMLYDLRVESARGEVRPDTPASALAEEFLAVALDPDRGPARRGRDLETLAGMTEVLGRPGDTERLWRVLSSHSAEADFDRQRDLLTRIAHRGGTDRALRLWETLAARPLDYRESAGATLDRTADELGDYSVALDLWPRLAAHLEDEDFETRRSALSRWTKLAGRDRALAAWDQLEAFSPALQTRAAAAIEKLAGELDPERAIALWPLLRPHLTESEGGFEVRRASLSALARLAGNPAAIERWPSVAGRSAEAARRAVDAFAHACETLKQPEPALALWSEIQAHCEDADFEDQHRALAELSRGIGPEEALEHWPTLCADRPGTRCSRVNRFLLAGKLCGSGNSGTHRAHQLEVYRQLLAAEPSERALEALDTLARMSWAVGFQAEGGWALTQVDGFQDVWTDSPEGNYRSSHTAALTLAPIALAAMENPELRYRARYDLENGYDNLFVEASADGQSWKSLASFTGKGSWSDQRHDLSKLGSGPVRIRFRLITDHVGEADGFYLRDLKVQDRAGSQSGPGELAKEAVAAVLELATREPAAHREPDVVSLAEIARTVGSLEQALELWRALEGHAREQDFSVRREALARLGQALGSEKALTMWRDIAGDGAAQQGRLVSVLSRCASELGGFEAAAELWPALVPLRADPELPARAEALAGLAKTFGSRETAEVWSPLAGEPAAVQQKASEALRGLSGELGDPARALELWPALSPHLKEERFADRVASIGRLAREGGTELALGVWPSLSARPATASPGDAEQVILMRGELVHPEHVLKLWPELSKFGSRADVGDRRTALARLANQVGPERALEFWPAFQAGAGSRVERVSVFRLAGLLAASAPAEAREQERWRQYQRLIALNLEQRPAEVLEKLVLQARARSWSPQGEWCLVQDAEGVRWLDNPRGQYGANLDAAITSPPIRLEQSALRFTRQFELEADYDHCYLELEQGGSWKRLRDYTRKDGRQEETVDLSAYRGSTVRLRFRLTSDHVGFGKGFELGELRLVSDGNEKTAVDLMLGSGDGGRVVHDVLLSEKLSGDERNRSLSFMGSLSPGDALRVLAFYQEHEDVLGRYGLVEFLSSLSSTVLEQQDLEKAMKDLLAAKIAWRIEHGETEVSVGGVVVPKRQP
ncbi:MAG: hypothetical protein HY319_32725 [Armatimonadetes bacterium]|nr:hypothetical protein [Armatimonadota bacterium]